MITDYIDMYTFLCLFYSLQIYQLPYIVILCVTAFHNDERHLIKDFSTKEENETISIIATKEITQKDRMIKLSDKMSA